jgi:protein involved in temperature-dependent protein secretion
LAKNTGDNSYYEILRDLYIEQIKLSPRNFQYHASLAYAHSILGEYDKAREQAAIVLELSPESRDNVEAFLKTLPPVE